MLKILDNQIKHHYVLFFCKGDNHASVEFFKSLQQIAKEVRIHELCICPPNLNFSSNLLLFIYEFTNNLNIQFYAPEHFK